MSLTLKLSDAEATVLHAKAAADGLSLEEWLRKLAQPEPQTTKDNASQPDQTRRHIWEIITENMKDVPPEDFAALPKDGLSQIDHYVYGTPKRTP
jgi:hypothetical protein